MGPSRPIEGILSDMGYDSPKRRGALFVIEDNDDTFFVRWNEKTQQYEAWQKGAFQPEIKESDPDEFDKLFMEMYGIAS